MIIWEQTQRRILNIIHTKNSPKYKLSNEASCLAPTKTTKNSKKIQVWERSSCVVCILGESSTPLFIHDWGQYGGGKLGNYHEPTLGIIIAPPDEGWPERRWWGCGRTPSAAGHGQALLATAFAWLLLGWAWVLATSVLGLDLQDTWAFLLFPLSGSALHFL